LPSSPFPIYWNAKQPKQKRKQGFDLADYLIKFNYKEFQPTEAETPNALQAFDKWLCNNPNGGLFEYLGSKFKVKPNPKQYSIENDLQ
jgi:hypothetical protein